MKSFEELDCWKECRNLRLFISQEVAPKLPKEEAQRLRDQLLRSARLTTANIAEGYGRFHFLDNARFCSNSRGSCWEVLDHLITAKDEGFIPESLLIEGRKRVNAPVRILNGYLTYLKRANQQPITGSR